MMTEDLFVGQYTRVLSVCAYKDGSQQIIYVFLHPQLLAGDLKFFKLHHAMLCHYVAPIAPHK